MNEDSDKEISPCRDKSTFLAEIERLYLEGYPTREIARLLGEDGNTVGRNLREIKRRWARAAGRQRAALSQTQCAAVYREALRGWQRSQQPKLTITEHRDADGNAVKTSTRCQEGPGDKAFLVAAISAMKSLRQFAADRLSEPPERDVKANDAHYVALLQVLKPEQLEDLDSDQLEAFDAALRRVRTMIDDAQKELEGRHDGPGGSPAADEAGLPSEPAAQGSGGDSASSAGEAAPAPADAELASAESEDPCPALNDPRSTEEPTDDSRPAAATPSKAETAAPAPAVTAAGLGAMPYPPIPMLDGKPPTPEVHRAFQQWHDDTWQSAFIRQYFTATAATCARLGGYARRCVSRPAERRANTAEKRKEEFGADPHRYHFAKLIFDN